MRDNIEAAAMAILMAVGLKYFLIEAFEIPTPSMQPALMGSKEAGIHDRILVNKAAYLLRQPPRRWDIAVFHYPHNQSQNYVKRIVGLPGERLKIVQGDIFRVTRQGNRPPTHEVVRKPSSLQRSLWKSFYSQSEDSFLDRTFHLRSSRGLWKRSEGQLIVDGTGPDGARTIFMPPDEPRDHYWHGYPSFLHETLSASVHGRSDVGDNVIGDLRWTMRVTPEGAERIVLWHEERPRQGPPRACCLRLERTSAEAATATLEFWRDARTVGNGSASPTRVEKIEGVPFRDGVALDLEFANYDDRLEASAGGLALPSLEYDVRPEWLDHVELRIECRGKARFQDAALARDLFYDPTDPQAPLVYEIPEEHYWMLGDNQKKSDDGRSWRMMRLWVTAEGRLAPKGQGRLIEGNWRYFSPDRQPDPDENPVVVPQHGKIVFTDRQGEEHVITGTAEELERHMETVETGSVRFVPRRFMVGRAFATFWPANPFGWFRVGLIR